MGFNSHVQVWKDALVLKAKDPYMRHEQPGSLVETVRFRPFEDVLGIGHADGISTIVSERSLVQCCEALSCFPSCRRRVTVA